MNKNYVALDKDDNVIKETRIEAEIFRWAWFSDYERGEIDIIAVPPNHGHTYL